MQILIYNDQVIGLRQRLMDYLNEMSLNAAAILSISRHAEPVACNPGEPILRQGVREHYVYFLMVGTALIRLKTGKEERILGDRQPVSMLGEISFFNDAPASASVEANTETRVLLFRIEYEKFRGIVDEFPQVRDVLTRIGDMRLISQYNGLAGYGMFMDMIGGLRDRFAINRAAMPPFEILLDNTFLPLVGETDKVMEVGDGPGIVCEVLSEKRPEIRDNLYIQATQLEDAIANPHTATPSDLTRAQYHTDSFAHIVALEVFNRMSPGRIPEQFKIAKKLVDSGGYLLMVKLRLLNIRYDDELANSQLLYATLESLVNQAWPDALDGGHLIETVFMDADLDPLMEWNSNFVSQVNKKQFKISNKFNAEQKVLLNLLLEQAKKSMFDPSEILFEWLTWQGTSQGLQLVKSEHQPEVDFFYHLFRVP